MTPQIMFDKPIHSSESSSIDAMLQNDLFAPESLNNLDMINASRGNGVEQVGGGYDRSLRCLDGLP